MGFQPGLNSLLKKLLEQDGCHWAPASPDKGAISQLRRSVQRAQSLRQSSPKAALVRLALLTSWPLRLSLHIRRYTRLLGDEVDSRFSVCKFKQVVDLYYFGLFFGLPASSYYQYKLFLPANRRKLSAYIYPHESGRLFAYLNGGANDLAVDNKIEFATRCAAFGISHTPTLALVSGRNLCICEDNWNKQGVVVKPATGSRGIGVKIFNSDGAGRYVADGETSISRSDVLDWLVKAGDGADHLMQPLLHNHDGLRHLSHGPLITARIITKMTGRDEYQVLAAVLQIPYRSQLTNNNGIGAGIELGSGLVGRAYPYRPLHPGFDFHPDTQGKITGTKVPFWEDALRLVRVAHTLFPNCCSLGWDVALTPDGPVLLETNSGWDVVMPQTACGRPLAEYLCSGGRQLTGEPLESARR